MRAHLLAKTRLAVFALSAVDEGRRFGVEAVQAIGVLIDEGVVLRHELPADLRGIDSRVVGHDGARGGLKRRKFSGRSFAGQR